MIEQALISLSETTSARTPDFIRVFLKDCRVDLHVGVYSAEMQKPQTVVITVEIEASLPHRYQDLTEKKLDRVIDYEPIYNFIQNDLSKMGHLYLIETVAEQIIAFCFQDIRIQKVSVRIEKIEAFAKASAGIEVHRSRSTVL